MACPWILCFRCTLILSIKKYSSKFKVEDVLSSWMVQVVPSSQLWEEGDGMFWSGKLLGISSAQNEVGCLQGVPAHCCFEWVCKSCLRAVTFSKEQIPVSPSGVCFTTSPCHGKHRLWGYDRRDGLCPAGRGCGGFVLWKALAMKLQGWVKALEKTPCYQGLAGSWPARCCCAIVSLWPAVISSLFAVSWSNSPLLMLMAFWPSTFCCFFPFPWVLF